MLEQTTRPKSGLIWIVKRGGLVGFDSDDADALRLADRFDV